MSLRKANYNCKVNRLLAYLTSYNKHLRERIESLLELEKKTNQLISQCGEYLKNEEGDNTLELFLDIFLGLETEEDEENVIRNFFKYLDGVNL